MSSASQFLGRRVTKGIHNQAFINTDQPWVNYAPSVDAPAVVAGGSFTADVYKTLLSVSGAGEFSVLYLRTNTNTTNPRTISVRLTVDGVVLYQASKSGVGTLNSLVFGARSSPFILFNSSVLFEVASNYSDTEFCNLYYVLHTY